MIRATGFQEPLCRPSNWTTSVERPGEADRPDIGLGFAELDAIVFQARDDVAEVVLTACAEAEIGAAVVTRDICAPAESCNSISAFQPANPARANKSKFPIEYKPSADTETAEVLALKRVGHGVVTQTMLSG